MDNVEVEDSEFSSVVDTLVNMFGNVLNKDVITAVVETFSGDLNLSAEAIMNMTDATPLEKTDPDVCPIKISENNDEHNSNMDLISFANTDHDFRIPEVAPNAAASGDSSPPLTYIFPTVTENTKNDLSGNYSVANKISSNDVTPSLEIKSTLNVDASDYIPRLSSQIEGLSMHTHSRPIIKSSEKSETMSKMPSSSQAWISQYNDESKQRPMEDNTFQSLISYSSISQKTGALPKKVVKSVKPERDSKFPPHLRRMTEYHSQGFRILIIMRGAPGSGKSYLSRQIIQATIGENNVNYKAHIFSSDDFFSLRGPYEFNKYYLRDAHAWNQQRAKSAMEKGLSPVIIDNTNIEIWEMEPYLRDGVMNGYRVEVMEPKTPWARKPNQLMKKNIHGVPLNNIIRMLENYVENVTGDYLINYYKLSYPDRMTPPVLRNHPPVVSSAPNNNNNNKIHNKPLSPLSESIVSSDIKVNKDDSCIDSNHLVVSDTKSNKYITPSQLSTITCDKSFDSESIDKNNDNVDTNEDVTKLDRYLSLQKQLEDLEKLDREWEQSAPWDDNVQNENSKSVVESGPKSQRNRISTRPESNQSFIKDCPDWSEISMFMTPWSDGVQIKEKEPVMPVETVSTGTCVEMGDTDIYNGDKIYKVLSATPRDINEHHISPYKEKIPEKRMLDKSSMTNERLITEISRCKNEERHFNAFRKLFKTIPKSDLRDIFDQCRGDVNWAVEIVLDGISNNQLQFIETLDVSDVEDENPEQCTCLAAYNIVPDTEVKSEIENTDLDIPDTTTENVHFQRKPKKEVPLSEMSIQLKRQIEQNVVIADNHYSQHSLKIRKLYRGESYVSEAETEEINSEYTDNAVGLNPLAPSFEIHNQAESLNDEIDNDNDSNESVEELEKIVNMNVGVEFIKSMDEMFGRRGMTYPENVIPKLSIPISLVNELNALWMESLMHQLDDYDKQSAKMFKQDEEFARQLAAKEMELAEAGKEPEVPDFKEIMDMDFAMSLYHKDVAEWRNKEPNNLAAKLTRDKLFNLFPDLPQDTLSELLVAHDNNFKTTVEVLLMSTGRSEILEEKNGLVKFVMAKELERQEKLMEEEKKALSEVEWPLLPKGEQVDMSTVNDYRKHAERHLAHRNKSYSKAQEYFYRGMTQVATYYSDVAAFHKQMFDQANSRAAATLMQVHALNSPNNATIDLHYLRVGEALESLDLFLDTHISKLKESQAANRGPKQHTLFFITGRGLHSQGGPKIKPAVKKRLLERGISCSERNPGLLCARVCADDKLSYQVQM